MIYHNSIINIFTIRNSHSFIPNEDGYHANETLSEQKSRKMVKKEVILIGGYSDYYCKRPLYSKCFFGFCFLVGYCCVHSVVFFTSSETSLQWSHRLLAEHLQCKVRLMYCMVILHCIWRGFEAILIASFFSRYISFIPQRNQREIGHLPTS